MAYGIATNNPFALLGGDEENDDPQKIQVPPQPVAPVKSDQPPQGSQPGQGARGRGGRGRSERGGRGGRLGGRGGRGRGGYEQRGYYDSGEQGYDADVPPVSRGGRQGGRGGGRGRGGEGGYRGPKRDFDRRDQSGRGHEMEKRGGIGKGNWGGATDSWEDTPAEEAPPATEQNGEALAEGEPAADGEVKEGGADEAVEKEEEEKEAPKFTLAEYEEMMKEKLLTKTVQKVEVDMKQFEGLAKLEKEDVETGFESLEIEKTTRMKQKAKKEFIPVETGFRVGDPVRRGRGRGGGRGGRSRDFEREGSGRFDSNADGGDGGNYASGSGGGNYRGRGGGRRGDRRSGSYGGSGSYAGYAAQPKQPDMADQASFPSLS